MPKTVELTIEIEVQKVSCPGVWLCQDGRVSLTVFALGTSFQTCLLPPTFPLEFRDVFYFRKKFKEGCALNNICCLLKDETIYCELVQWCHDCMSGECVILAQYLGSLNDVLFPPNMCSTDGVDLLMRRAKDFPGILSPKIEIATKLRLDEIRTSGSSFDSRKEKEESNLEGNVANRQDCESGRQRQVCHSPHYHRNRCNKSKKRATSRTRYSSRTYASKSNSSLNTREDCVKCPMPHCKPQSARSSRRDHSVYSVDTFCSRAAVDHYCNEQNTSANETEDANILPHEYEKALLESRYIAVESKDDAPKKKLQFASKVTPCICEICRKYHEIFHNQS